MQGLFLAAAKKTWNDIMYDASVNSTQDPGEFDKNFCLGQGIGHLPDLKIN